MEKTLEQKKIEMAREQYEQEQKKSRKPNYPWNSMKKLLVGVK